MVPVGTTAPTTKMQKETTAWGIKTLRHCLFCFNIYNLLNQKLFT